MVAGNGAYLCRQSMTISREVVVEKFLSRMLVMDGHLLFESKNSELNRVHLPGIDNRIRHQNIIFNYEVLPVDGCWGKEDIFRDRRIECCPMSCTS